MPRINSETEEQLRSTIKSNLVVRPDISVLKMVSTLKVQGIDRDKDYVHRLMRDVKKEMIAEVENSNLTDVLSVFNEDMKYAKMMMHTIVNSGDNREKVMASRELREWGNAWINRLMDAGVMHRVLGELSVKAELTVEQSAELNAAREALQHVINIAKPANDTERNE